MSEKNRKVTIRITEDMHEDIQRFLPWGIRQTLFEHAIKLILNEVHKSGICKTTARLNKADVLSDAFGSYKKAEDIEATKRGEG